MTDLAVLQYKVRELTGSPPFVVWHKDARRCYELAVAHNIPIEFEGNLVYSGFVTEVYTDYESKIIATNIVILRAFINLLTQPSI